MHWLLSAILFSLSNGFDQIDYCSVNPRHGFCNVDCLRSPPLCNVKLQNDKKFNNRHYQLEITERQIKRITLALNQLRFLTTTQNLVYKFNQKEIKLEKATFMNMVVSISIDQLLHDFIIGWERFLVTRPSEGVK